MSNLVEVSSAALYTAFIIYLIATLFFGATIRDKKSRGKKSYAGTIAISLTILGFIAQFVYFITRWIASGHAPLSNMFEFVTFLGYEFSTSIYHYLFYLSSFHTRIIRFTNRDANYRLCEYVSI